MAQFSHPSPSEVQTFLDQVLFNIQKPGRYIGGEFNQVIKDWDSCEVRSVLAFPDVYEIGFSNLGLNILYDQVNYHSPFMAERVFSVWEDMERVMRENGIPLFSLESKHPIVDFDLVGISIPYETLYTNTLNMLDLADIPIYSKDRTEKHPIIVAGGHSTFNPAPMSPFIDAFVIGDGENIFLEILKILSQARSRDEKLEMMSELNGIYVPSKYDVKQYFTGLATSENPLKPIRKNMVAHLPVPPEKPLVPNIETTHNRIAVEVMRGCSHGCRFCQAGFITRPVRERPVHQIMDSLRSAVRQTGYDEISLLSLSISDHSAVQDLVVQITDEFSSANVNLSLPSLRIESFSKDLMDSMDQRKGNFTLAPESASETMRRTINKPISEQDLLETASQIFQQGWTSIKLYFLIGLPGESVQDVEEISVLCRKVKSIGKKMIGGRARVSVSINTFIPKCHTPFQWAAMDSDENIRQKHQVLRDGFRNSGIKLSFPSLESSLLEGWLSRADEKTAAVIYEAWKQGARFDAWQEYHTFETWKNAFSTCEIDPYEHSHRKIDPEEVLPWDFIDTGVSKSFLKREYQKSNEGSLTTDCRNLCSACGIQANFGIVCRSLTGEID